MYCLYIQLQILMNSTYFLLESCSNDANEEPILLNYSRAFQHAIKVESANTNPFLKASIFMLLSLVIGAHLQLSKMSPGQSKDKLE